MSVNGNGVRERGVNGHGMSAVSPAAVTGELAPARLGVALIASAIREELHRRNGAGRNGDPAPIPWYRLHTELDIAQENAQVGIVMPEMRNFRGLKRLVVRFVAKCVLILSRAVTNRQRQFNNTILGQLRLLTATTERLYQDQQNLGQDMFARLQDVVGARLGALEKAVSYARAALIAQERRMAVLFEEAHRRAGGGDGGAADAVLNEFDHMYDGLYLEFEDQFRGSRQEVRERLKVYVPLLREAKVGDQAMPILDVGCGRGEWLELLRDEGFVAEGVDFNRVLLEQCRERGLRVFEGDVIAHLRARPDASVGVVTGFHIIEHLPFPVLLKLFDEAVRVLKPGGMVIFETPNPENVLVGASYFYVDPTHRNPLFPATVKFLAEQRGLTEVRLLGLPEHLWTNQPIEPLPEDHDLAGRLNPLLNLIKTRFYCSADFAVIGRKAA